MEQHENGNPFSQEKSMHHSVWNRARNLLFLFQTPQERLGCDPQTGFADIQSHPFFRQIDWDMLYNKQITPPYKPPVNSETDLEHFDPQFTNEPVQLTPDDQ